jgi:uncharacterized protein YukE
MPKANDAEQRAVKNMRSTVQTLSEMLTHTVAEAHRLQRQQEKALGRRFESQQELLESYDTKTMKELTAVLKDITTVTKALEESCAGQDAAQTGIVLLPPVSLPPEQGSKGPEGQSLN